MLPPIMMLDYWKSIHVTILPFRTANYMNQGKLHYYHVPDDKWRMIIVPRKFFKTFSTGIVLERFLFNLMISETTHTWRLATLNELKAC